MGYDEFRPPAVSIGTMVEFAMSPTENTRCLGVVAKVGKQFVDVNCYFANGTQGKRRHCLHRSDPRCEALPEIFKDGDRGVWELTESEKRARELSARLDGLERLLESVVDEVAAMRRAAEPTTDADPPRRGRPRRREPVLTG